MSLAIILSVFIPLPLSAQQVDVPSNQDDLHLFLLIGQSNMAGRGKVTEADRKPIPNVLMLNQQNQWVPAIDPMHFDKPNLVGVGLGRSFAAEVVKASPGITVGLIPCAVGGSPISSWEPGGYHKQTKTHPYDDMIPRLDVALESGRLRGILWHQGEADSKPELSAVYEQKLHSLIKRLREHVGDQAMPFVVGQLGQFEEKPWSEDRARVNAVHQSLPDIVAQTAFVKSDGLGHKGDQVHFHAEAYREFGRRYAEAFFSISK